MIRGYFLSRTLPARLVPLSVGVILLVTPTAHADPEVDGGVQGDTVFVAAVEETARDASGSDTAAVSSDDGQPAFVEYRWLIVCSTPGTSPAGFSEVDCQAAQVCAEPGELLFRLWGRSETTDAWTPLSTRCFGEVPTEADAPRRPQVTPALVLNELRRIGLPTLQALTQPEGETLVNFDTIFYTRAEPFTATVRLLGQQVDIVAEATQYTWHHGDGSSTTTSTPGEPYPSREITYRYADADITVRPRVDVTYAARFRVNGGSWRDIDETVTIAGREGTLRVSEARAALSGNYG